jgi:hypothetical protein
MYREVVNIRPGSSNETKSPRRQRSQAQEQFFRQALIET